MTYYKGSALHFKVVMKELDRDNHIFTITSLICCLTLQLFQIDEPIKANGDNLKAENHGINESIIVTFSCF